MDLAVLARALGRDLVLLLGDKDTEPQTVPDEQAIDSQHSRDALAQGQNRFARGLRFFATATEEANSLGFPLARRLRLAAGIDHDPPLMVRAAFQDCFGEARGAVEQAHEADERPWPPGKAPQLMRNVGQADQ